MSANGTNAVTVQPGKPGPSCESATPLKIGLVLAGGGFKGSFQIGAWKALREKLAKMGITRFHAIAGTSVGALNAVLIANDDPQAAERIWLERDIVRFAPRALGWYALAYFLLLGPIVMDPFIFVAGVWGYWSNLRSSGLLLTIASWLVRTSF
jgi:NTE family protein